MFRVIIHVYNTYCTHGYIVIHIDTRSFYAPSDKNLLDIGENCKPFVVFQFYHSPSFLVTNSALLTVFVLKVKEGWLCNFGVKELTASSLVGNFFSLILEPKDQKNFPDHLLSSWYISFNFSMDSTSSTEPQGLALLCTKHS